MDLADLLRHHVDQVAALVPGVELFDAHTHLGFNDPDGMRQSPEELLENLQRTGARGAFTFPFHEPEGYPEANDAVLAAAEASDGLLVPFCRVDPHDSPLAEAKRSLDAGARGIKLHPRAEQFTLDHPEVQPADRARPRALAAGAHPRRPGHPGARPARRASWRASSPTRGSSSPTPASVTCPGSGAWPPSTPTCSSTPPGGCPQTSLALFSLVPPGQILFASDAPYGNTGFSAAFQLRTALVAGLSEAQIRSITSEQSLRIADGEPLVPAGPAVGERERAPHVLLDRVAQFLMLARDLGHARRRSDRDARPGPPGLRRARATSTTRRSSPPSSSCSTAMRRTPPPHPDDRRRLTFLILAATLARTPEVPLPA